MLLLICALATTTAIVCPQGRSVSWSGQNKPGDCIESSTVENETCEEGMDTCSEVLVVTHPRQYMCAAAQKDPPGPCPENQLNKCEKKSYSCAKASECKEQPKSYQNFHKAEYDHYAGSFKGGVWQADCENERCDAQETKCTIPPTEVPTKEPTKAPTTKTATKTADTKTADAAACDRSGQAAYAPGDCVLNGSPDKTNCNGTNFNLDLYVKESNGTYIMHKEGCVIGNNLNWMSKSDTVESCQKMCDADDKCKAIEFGVAYGGPGKGTKSNGDCTADTTKAAEFRDSLSSALSPVPCLFVTVLTIAAATIGI